MYRKNRGGVHLIPRVLGWGRSSSIELDVGDSSQEGIHLAKEVGVDKVVPRNRGGLLRTWPLLIVILRVSSTHFLQRVRVKNSKSGARARARARARASFFKIA